MMTSEDRETTYKTQLTKLKTRSFACSKGGTTSCKYKQKGVKTCGSFMWVDTNKLTHLSAPGYGLARWVGVLI